MVGSHGYIFYFVRSGPSLKQLWSLVEPPDPGLVLWSLCGLLDDYQRRPRRFVFVFDTSSTDFYGTLSTFQSLNLSSKTGSWKKRWNDFASLFVIDVKSCTDMIRMYKNMDIRKVFLYLYFHNFLYTVRIQGWKVPYACMLKIEMARFINFTFHAFRVHEIDLLIDVKNFRSAFSGFESTATGPTFLQWPRILSKW